MKISKVDRFRGCFLAGAIGDALGYAIEFLSESDIVDKYGQNGIKDFEYEKGKALISDDTQMTLFTADALLLAKDGKEIESIWKCYKDWVNTQLGEQNIGIKGYSSLLQYDELFASRAPGRTCMMSIVRNEKGSVKIPYNNSKGCGGIMRSAPIGLFYEDKNADDIAILSAEASALTHGHELGYIPSATFAVIIHEIVYKGHKIKEATEEAMKTTEKLYGDKEYFHDFKELMNLAVELVDSNIETLDAIHRLGEGWVAEETLAIAIYCAIKYQEDFVKGITASVNHGGDSDSTGSVAGNILGAYLGKEKIYENIKNHKKNGYFVNYKKEDSLELYNIIIDVSDKLCSLGQ